MECPICNSNNIQTELVNTGDLGFGIPTLSFNNVRKFTCEDCGEESIEIPRFNQVKKQIQEKICFRKPPLHGSEFSLLRKELSLSGLECSKVFGVSNVTISRWENNTSPIPGPADRHIRTLTLISFNYSVNNIIKTIGDVDEHGTGEISIDLNNFRESSYVHETCLSFNTELEEERVWVYNNV